MSSSTDKNRQESRQIHPRLFGVGTDTHRVHTCHNETTGTQKGPFVRVCPRHARRSVCLFHRWNHYDARPKSARSCSSKSFSAAKPLQFSPSLRADPNTRSAMVDKASRLASSLRSSASCLSQRVGASRVACAAGSGLRHFLLERSLDVK